MPGGSIGAAPQVVIICKLSGELDLHFLGDSLSTYAGHTNLCGTYESYLCIEQHCEETSRYNWNDWCASAVDALFV